MTKNMTMTTFLTAVAEANISEDMTNFAKAEIAKIEAKNAKRRATPSKASQANLETLDSIIFEMTEGGLAENGATTAASVAKVFGITPQKASAILAAGVKSGRLVETEPIKVKSGKVKGYAIAK